MNIRQGLYSVTPAVVMLAQIRVHISWSVNSGRALVCIDQPLTVTISPPLCVEDEVWTRPANSRDVCLSTNDVTGPVRAQQ